MARIPDVSDFGARPIPQARAPRVVDQSGEILNDATSRVASNIGRVAQQITAREDQAQFAQARSQLLQADIATRQELENDNDYATYETRYREKMSKALDGVSSKIRSRFDRAAFDQETKLDIARGAGVIQDLAMRKEADVGRASLDETLASNRSAALEAKDEATRAAFVNATAQAISGARDKGYISAEGASETRRKWTTDYAEGFLDVQSLPDRIRLLKAPKGSAVNFIDADRRAVLLRQAEQELERQQRERQAELQQSLSNDLKDSFAARQAGLTANLPSKARFDAAYGAKGAEHYQNATASWGIFDVVAQAANENPADAQKTLAQLKPTEQSGAANAANRYQDGVKLWEQQRKQLEDDPAATLVARDPKLAALMQQATTPEGTQKYLAAIQVREASLGVEKPRLLPVAYADEMARSLTFNPEKPTQRIETLQGLQAAYGKAFPKIVEEIAPKLDGHARVLVNMLPEDAKRLDAAVAQGAKTINDLLPKNAQADITTYVDQNLSGLSRTLADNPDAESRIHEHREAAQLLAGSLALRGASPREAAKMATDAVVNNRYAYTETARILLQYDSQHVQEGAQAKLLDASRAPLSIAAGNRSDAPTAIKDLQEVVRDKGYWITNEDETGLVLRIPHRRGLGEVYDAKGKRIEYTWDELLKTRPASIEEFPSIMEWKP